MKFVGRDYSAHSAIEAVHALAELIRLCEVKLEEMQQHSFTWHWFIKYYHSGLNAKQHRVTLQPLLAGKVISDGMAMKVAISGLEMRHLRTAFMRNEPGIEGLRCVLGEKFGNKRTIRVTNNKIIISAIAESFNNSPGMI